MKRILNILLLLSLIIPMTVFSQKRELDQYFRAEKVNDSVYTIKLVDRLIVTDSIIPREENGYLLIHQEQETIYFKYEKDSLTYKGINLRNGNPFWNRYGMDKAYNKPGTKIPDGKETNIIYKNLFLTQINQEISHWTLYNNSNQTFYAGSTVKENVINNWWKLLLMILLSLYLGYLIGKSSNAVNIFNKDYLKRYRRESLSETLGTSFLAFLFISIFWCFLFDNPTFEENTRYISLITKYERLYLIILRYLVIAGVAIGFGYKNSKKINK